MNVAQKVVHSLNGVECDEGYLDKYCAPIAHCTVPQSGKLHCLKLAAALRLVRDESCVLVNECGKVELLALITLNGADKVNGVKVCAILEHRL